MSDESNLQEQADEPTPQEEIYWGLIECLRMMKAGKPEERSEAARRWAVSITELEKAIAYFYAWVIGQEAVSE